MISRVACCLLIAAVAQGAETIQFRKTVLDTKFRAEGVAVGDFNHDGRLDVAAGDLYYAAPDWRPVATQVDAKSGQPREYDPLRYSNCFQAWSDDLNGDGWTDILLVDFPGTQTVWLENPRDSARPWTRHVILPCTNNESPIYADIDGNGRRALICGWSPDPAQFDGPERRMIIARRASEPTAPWTVEQVSEPAAPSTTRFSHGLGVGDVNGDGHLDILVPQGWWAAPAEKSSAPWAFQPATLGPAAAYMHVFDYDGDGDMDILSSSAHQLGIWWFENTTQGFKQHLISELFSQTHALVQIDLNSDGLPDFITGKRYWAHGPKGDVDPGAPAVLYWFELRREGGKPVWIPHPIDDDSGIGTQFEVTDLNGDGLLDIAVANKKGVFIFEQFRK